MPFIGTLDGETVIPEGVENGTDVICPECGEQMHPWGPSVDGRARHFQHYSNRQCVTAGGESAVHRKLKSIAVSKLRSIFGEQAAACEPEVTLDAPKSDAADRRADALVRFDERDEQLGNGLIIEVQYKNKGKDRRATERDYLAQDYAVVWVTPYDYEDNELTHTERSLRLRARHAAIEHFHEFVDVPDFYQRPRRRFMDLDLSESAVPATIPADQYDRAARNLWEQQPWESLFSPPTDYLSEIEGKNVPVEIDVAPWLDKQFWKENWLEGTNTGPKYAIPCAECGKMITADGDEEPVAKRLKFHVKREHKQMLQQRDSYRPFIDAKHASRLDVNGRKRLK
jgi:predicted small metal-binding protein